MPLTPDEADWIERGAPDKTIQPLSADSREKISRNILRIAAVDPFENESRQQIRVLLGYWSAGCWDLGKSAPNWIGDLSAPARLTRMLRARTRYGWLTLRHSRQAHRTDVAIRHEHAIPLDLVIDHIRATRFTEPSLRAFLNRYCVGVLLAAAESKALPPTMPEGWNFQDGSPLARVERLVEAPGRCPGCAPVRTFNPETARDRGPAKDTRR